MKNLGLNSLAVWFGILMIVLVLSGAIAITFTDFMDDRLFGTKRMFFLILLLGYAVYRGFRLYSLLKQPKKDED